MGVAQSGPYIIHKMWVQSLCIKSFVTLNPKGTALEKVLCPKFLNSNPEN